LPPTLPNNPTYRKVNPADAPILILALTSDTLSRGRMYDAASSILRKLSQVPGVGQVTVGGGSLPAVRVELNPTAAEQVRDQPRGHPQRAACHQHQSAEGTAGRQCQGFEILTNDQLRTAEEYAPVIIAYRSGRAVQLADVGGIDEAVEDLRTTGLANGKPAVLVVIFRQPGANIIDTVDNIRDLLPQLQASIAGAIDHQSFSTAPRPFARRCTTSR
jgi:multidrug efflux pump